jgi:hypothetical protein
MPILDAELEGAGAFRPLHATPRNIRPSGPEEPMGFVSGHDFTACGKTPPKGFCNKGTALAGPQKLP